MLFTGNISSRLLIKRHRFGSIVKFHQPSSQPAGKPQPSHKPANKSTWSFLRGMTVSSQLVTYNTSNHLTTDWLTPLLIRKHWYSSCFAEYLLLRAKVSTDLLQVSANNQPTIQQADQARCQPAIHIQLKRINQPPTDQPAIQHKHATT